MREGGTQESGSKKAFLPLVSLQLPLVMRPNIMVQRKGDFTKPICIITEQEGRVDWELRGNDCHFY